MGHFYAIVSMDPYWKIQYCYAIVNISVKLSLTLVHKVQTIKISVTVARCYVIVIAVIVDCIVLINTYPEQRAIRDLRVTVSSPYFVILRYW